MKPESASKAASVAHLAPIMPYLMADIDKMKVMALRKAYNTIEKGEMDPETALGVLLQLHAMDKLAQMFQNRLKSSVAVAETLQETLNA